LSSSPGAGFPNLLTYSFKFTTFPKYDTLSLRGQMAPRKIIYPKSLKDIPLWRQRQLTQDLLWFSKFSPVERLRYIDREWDEIQKFISKFGLKKRGTGKRD